MFGIQIPFLITNIILNVFIYTEDSIDFCIKSGDKEQALKQIRNVYSGESAEVHERVWQEKHDQHAEK